MILILAHPEVGLFVVGEVECEIVVSLSNDLVEWPGLRLPHINRV